ncbi:MAG TPA: terminase family protein [Planctomycetota bacterium]|jgi:hypothetical protein
MLLKAYGVAKQIDFWQSTARYRAFFGGRRAGKTQATTVDIIIQALKQKNRRLLYIAPTNSLAKETFEQIAYHAALTPLIQSTDRKGPYRLALKNGSVIDFKNSLANIHRLRGFKYHVVYVDEAQLFPETFLPIVEACIRDTRGRLVILGQFNGQNYLYYRFYLQGQSPVLLDNQGQPLKDAGGKPRKNDGLYASWHLPTDEGLMFQGKLGRAEIEEARQTTTLNQYQQEYACLPTASMSACYSHEDVTACLGGEPLEKAESPRHTYILAIDPAKEIDHTAAVVLCVETGRIVFARIWPKGTPYPQAARDCAEIQARFNRASAIIDSTGERGAAGGAKYRTQDPRSEVFRQHVGDLRAFVFNMTSKGHLTTHVGIELRNRTVRIPAAAKDLISQLLAYEYKYRSGGFYSYGAPRGQHDDLVSALQMALWARHNHWYDSRSLSHGHTYSGV